MVPQSGSRLKTVDSKAALPPIGHDSGGIAAPPPSSSPRGRAKTDDDAAPAVTLRVSEVAPLISHAQMQQYKVGYPDASLVAVKDKARPAHRPSLSRLGLCGTHSYHAAGQLWATLSLRQVGAIKSGVWATTVGNERETRPKR